MKQNFFLSKKNNHCIVFYLKTVQNYECFFYSYLPILSRNSVILPSFKIGYMFYVKKVEDESSL